MPGTAAASADGLGDIFGSSAPAPKASGLNDLFADEAPAAAVTDSVPAHPFHGDSVVASKASPGGLADFIDQQAPVAPSHSSTMYQVRKRSGRVFGPYDEPTILQMLRKQELAGNEDASTDGSNWNPLSQIAAFGEEIQAITAAALSSLGGIPSSSDPDLPGLANVDLPGLPNADLPGLPSANLPGLSNADLPGLPNADLPGLPNSNLPGLSNQDLPGTKQPAMWNPDERGKSTSAGAGDFMSDLGMSFSRGEADSASEAGPVDPADPLAVDLSISTEQKIAGQRKQKRQVRGARKAGKGKTVALTVAGVLLTILVAAGIFTGIATNYGFFGYRWISAQLQPTDVDDSTSVDNTPLEPLTNLAKLDLKGILEKDTYSGYTRALFLLDTHVDKNPDAAAKNAYVNALLALLHNDTGAVAAGRKSLTKAGEFAQTPRAVFAQAVFEYSDGQCDAAHDILKAEVGETPPEQPKPDKIELLVLMGLAQTCRTLKDWDKAERFVDAALIADPRNTLALWAQARIATQQGNNATAVAYLEKALEQKPDHPRFSLLLAESLVQQKKLKQAHAYYDIALAHMSGLAPWESGRASLGLARIHSGRHEFKDALAVANKAVKAAGKHLPTLQAIGDYALQQYFYGVAQAVFRKAIKIDPDDSHAVVGFARALACNRNQLEAYEAVNKLLKQTPKDAYLNYWMGRVHESMMKRKEAKNFFNKARALDPKMPEPLVALVRMQLMVNNTELAQKILDKHRSEIDPNKIGQIELVQAEVYRKARRFDDALESLDKAEVGKANEGDILLLRGGIFLDRLYPRKAAPLIRQVYADNPNKPWAIGQMGVLVLAQGKAKEALKYLDDAAERDQTRAYYHLQKSVAYTALKDYESAIKAVNVAGEIEPDNPDLYYFKGLALQGQGQGKYKYALNAFKSAETAAEKDARYSLQIGVTFAKMETFIDAIDYFKAAIIKDPSWARAYYELGKAYMELVRYNTAREQFLQAERLRPDWAEVKLKIGETLSKGGDYQAALKKYRQAIKLNPQLTQADCRIGEVQKNNGRLAEAEIALVKCIKGLPRHNEAYKWLGYIYKDTRRPALAIKSFEKHLRYNPDDVESDLVREVVGVLKGTAPQ